MKFICFSLYSCLFCHPCGKKQSNPAQTTIENVMDFMDVLVLMETTGAAQKISIWKTFKMFCFNFDD